jgi:acetylornithine deacetylase/succinyl-diaminopimelate desuccinylase-like protein
VNKCSQPINILKEQICFADVGFAMQDVYEYIDKNADNFVKTLRQFLRMPAVSPNVEDCKKAAEMLQDIMVERGIETQIMPVLEEQPDIGGPVVYAEIKGERDKALIAYAHYDDKPADPVDEWVTPPWSADLREGPHGPTIYARGAVDNKSGCLAFVFAAEAFMKTRGMPPVTVKCVFEGEEEVGSTHLEDWAVRHKEMLKAEGLHCLDGGIGETGKPRVGIHGKAVLYVELWARGSKEDVHSGRSALVENPVWRLVHALASLKDVNDRILIDGWYDNWRKPEAEDLEYIKEEIADFDEEAVKKKFGTEGKPFPGNRTGLELFKEFRFGGTCAICGIHGGFTDPGRLMTIVPREAFAKIDFRCPPHLDPHEQFKKLEAYLTTKGFDDIQPKLVSARPNPWFTAPTESIVQAIHRAADLVYPGEDIGIGESTTAEGVFSVALGIPSAMTGFGNPDASLHAPNENLAVSHFIKGIKYAATIMQEFAKD